jgi:flagellar basal-body rod protein FlgC
MSLSYAFAVGEAGMAFEKARADAAAANIANINVTRSAAGGPYVPLQAVAVGKPLRSFSAFMDGNAAQLSLPMPEILQAGVQPKMVFDPGHPDADEKGFVAYPNVNLVSEMVTLMTANRAYEANVAAVNAAKAMALKTLDIGGTQ